MKQRFLILLWRLKEGGNPVEKPDVDTNVINAARALGIPSGVKLVDLLPLVKERLEDRMEVAGAFTVLAKELGYSPATLSRWAHASGAEVSMIIFFQEQDLKIFKKRVT